MKPRILTWAELDADQKAKALARPEIAKREFSREVAWIISQVRERGDAALFELTQKFDGCELQEIVVGKDLLETAEQQCPKELMIAIQDAETRIRHFHAQDIPGPTSIETAPGLTCQVRFQAIDDVGLYVPGGSAPLVSTVLMLGVPASLAGCSNITLCTPPGPDGRIAPEILYAASLCGITSVCAVGGAQAIGAMAYGTQSVAKCSKIFGPGNAWVTEAKQQVSLDPEGASIDMPAGPSEVLVIADNTADPQAVAWDLLSQAEHGPDSQAILLSDSPELATAAAGLTATLARELPRADVLELSLSSARIIITETIGEAIGIAGSYAPEHLIINTREARRHAESVRNAGSVFIGPWTPESLGDYCSGTNHVLPTYGWARSQNSLSVSEFMRRFTLQEASREALMAVGPTAETLAGFEGLKAHRMAIRHRLSAGASS